MNKQLEKYVTNNLPVINKILTNYLDIQSSSILEINANKIKILYN